MKKKPYKDVINANGREITVLSSGTDNDYLSLTDIAKYKSSEPNDVIKNWLRNRDTIEFLGLWELLNNPSFRRDAYNSFKSEAGKNAFTLSPKKWVTETGATGLRVKAGIGGGTYAHKDIAFEFASWVSAEFKLYIIKDYQRLKTDENSHISLDWNITRTLTKLNYKIQTDAIKETLIPTIVSKQQQSKTYADEADVLNIALFGETAKEWHEKNPNAQGNIRDNASLVELIVIANLQALNAELISRQISQNERLLQLNDSAIRQIRSLSENTSLKHLAETNDRDSV
ncbi:MAG TPA: KilA-N domain-containing protein [Methanocorpusculum sp.]|nr:KilA-N domain-containing protein [Methanocorpusculum sp.]